MHVARIAEAESTADRACSGEIPSRERLVHHRNERRARIVLKPDRAAGDERNPRRVRVGWPDIDVLHVDVFVGLRRVSFDGRALSAHGSAERAVRGERGGVDSRERVQALVQLAVENSYVGRLVAGEPRVQSRKHQVLAIEAKPLLLEIQQAAREQSGADEQDERHRDLGGDEQFGRAETAPARCDASAAGFDCRDEIDAARPNGGREAEQDAGDERDRDRECEHAAVQLCVHRRRRRHDQRQESTDRPACEDDAAQRAERREQQAFGEELPQEARAGCAERHPNGNFALPRGGAREQQVADVRARDQQHEQDDAEQDAQRLGVHLPEPGDSARSISQLDPRLLDLPRAIRRHLVARGVSEKLPQRGRGRRLRLDARHARRQAPDRVQPICVRLLEVRGPQLDLRVEDQRDPEIRRAPDALAEKFGRRDADDRERGAVEDRNLADGR